MPQINWMEWGEEAFEKAAKEKKPILLDIHGVWCHWCHVMDSNTYSEPEVIEIVNRDFVSIKVDTDKRPDVNKRYNMGGWPSTVFLTPTGQIITGTTYVPPDMLKDTMLTVLEAFREIKPVDVKIESKKLEAKEDAKISHEIVSAITENLSKYFDFSFGGFGVMPKFPLCDAVSLALQQYKKTGKKEHLILAGLTLDKMQGIFDKIEGGFYRYSVTQQWDEPHYEKMLETNSGLIENYLLGCEILKKEMYKSTATKSLDYIKNNLLNKQGAFYGSQDADEEYYKLDANKRKNHGKPKIDGHIYTDLSSMMLSTFCLAFQVLKDNFYRDFAVKSAKFLADKCYDEKFGMHHYFDGKRKYLPGNLSDNVYFIKALINVFEITGNNQHLEFAGILTKFVIENFMDKQDSCFFDKIKNPSDIGFLKYQDKPIIENSIQAINLVKLSKIKNEKKYLDSAENILKAFYSGYAKYGPHETIYALAVEEFLSDKVSHNNNL